MGRDRMIGVDANVPVRYATHDDPRQARVVEDLVDSLTSDNPGFVSVVALAEAVWVLRRGFRADADSIVIFVEHPINAGEIVVENSVAVRSAIDATHASALFTDALLGQLGRALGCEHTVTFDRRAAALPGMLLLETSAS